MRDARERWIVPAAQKVTSTLNAWGLSGIPAAYSASADRIITGRRGAEQKIVRSYPHQPICFNYDIRPYA